MYTLEGRSKFLLVSIFPRNVKEADAIKNIEELSELVTSYGGEVADIIMQRREVHDKGSFIGAGKINEIAEHIKKNQINIVVLNAVVKPGQIYDLFEVWSKINPKIEVWDRSDLILKIFSRNANTTEARLQIELAAMVHMGPRIYGMGLEMSRQGGGVGTRGIGETNTERMKRHWRSQMKKVQDKLAKLTQNRGALMQRRHDLGLQTISLIGYTNAGKTSLFNVLTGKKKFVANSLFATLDSTVGPIYLPPIKRQVLVSDTIGFIRDLPPQLIEAFKSTLLESIHADILIHVIDISDQEFERKIEVVEQILAELGIKEKREIYLFNKLDKVDGLYKGQLKKKYAQYTPLFISAKTEQGLNDFLNLISACLIPKAE